MTVTGSASGRRGTRVLGRLKGWTRYTYLAAGSRIGERFGRVGSWMCARELRANLEHRRRYQPHPLQDAESSLHSQNGEDGVIARLLELVGLDSGLCVEIGSSDGAENCTRALAEGGLSCVWVEADPASAKAARKLDLPGVTVIAERARRDTIASRLGVAGVPAEFDVLVVDIDSDDLGVMSGVLAEFRPAVVVAEYNALFRPSQAWSWSPRLGGWDNTFRHGASLQSLADAAARVGYELVYCESAGVNAFFVRADRLDDVAELKRTGVRVNYRPAAYSMNPTGHPLSRRAMNPMELLDEIDYGRVRVRRARLEFTAAAVRPGEPIGFSFVVFNGSRRWLTSQNPAPVDLHARVVPGALSSPPGDAARTPLCFPVRPGGESRLFGVIEAPSEPGSYQLVVSLVNEGRPWLEDIVGAGGQARVGVDVVEY